MRSALFLLAAVAGLAAAQNSTSGANQSLAQCVVACSEKAIVEHSGAAQKCINAKTDNERVECICRSDELVDSLQACLTSTCPALVGGLNLDEQCRQFNGAGTKSVGLLPVLALWPSEYGSSKASTFRQRPRCIVYCEILTDRALARAPVSRFGGNIVCFIRTEKTSDRY
ncbi:hypothetical protein AURDEDRAFT_184052 [Auricularia subglabra TFB-10046 SS5]|nr:hypothetical protein AURDEDRAFT_184052 [Auricularia subglabra TFB-10046 SS5]